MKRFLLMLAILMCSACLFTGCGGDGDDDSDAAPTTEDTDAGDGAVLPQIAMTPKER